MGNLSGFVQLFKLLIRRPLLRKSVYFRGLALSLLVLCGIRAIAAQTDVHEIADRVDAHYNGMRSLQADFTETYQGAGITRAESGTLWLKRPGCMRWEYSNT